MMIHIQIQWKSTCTVPKSVFIFAIKSCTCQCILAFYNTLSGTPHTSRFLPLSPESNTCNCKISIAVMHEVNQLWWASPFINLSVFRANNTTTTNTTKTTHYCYIIVTICWYIWSNTINGHIVSWELKLLVCYSSIHLSCNTARFHHICQVSTLGATYVGFPLTSWKT